jgi:hypothetical protein
VKEPTLAAVALRKPYMPIAVVQTVLDMLATSDPRARSARAEEFVDMRVVTELDRSGFIDQLYP